jgi:hypothetical protein
MMMFFTVLLTTNPYMTMNVFNNSGLFPYVESNLNSLGVTVLQSYVNSFQFVVFPSTV